MGKRPPCVLYQSFLVLSVFVHDAPNKGTHPPVMHLTSLESHHSQDLCEAPSLAATAHGILFIPLQRSACDWTQVSLLLLLFMAFGADAPHRPTQKVVWLKYHYCFCFSWPSVRMRRTVRLKRSCGLSASPTAEGR